MSRPSASKALERVTVIDLTRVRAGPACVRQLADWGANVIKVELRDPSTPTGERPDFAPRHDPDFQNLQRNKRSISIDLKSQEGLVIFRRLVERADVLVENFRPDVKDRLGIDYETLRVINPRLIYASVSGFGQDGPYKQRPGVDQIAQGMGGLMSVTGEPGRGPMRAGIAVADVSAGILAAFGILVALYERETSNQGQWVQTSLLQAQIFMLDFQAAHYLMAGKVAQQAGNNHPTLVPTGVFKTKDGYVNIAPTPPMWRRFCEAIGREDLIEHPDFCTSEARRANRDKLNEIIESITRQRNSATLIESLSQSDIPCGPIYTIDQTFADPQVRHLKASQELTSKTLGKISLLAQPVTLSRTPSTLAAAAPEYGEQTGEILAELGFTPDQIAGFRQRGIV